MSSGPKLSGGQWHGKNGCDDARNFRGDRRDLGSDNSDEITV